MTWLNSHSAVVFNIAYLISTRGRLDRGNSTLVFIKISKWLWVDCFECSTGDLDRYSGFTRLKGFWLLGT
jgi:hypothetical protein